MALSLEQFAPWVLFNRGTEVQQLSFGFMLCFGCPLGLVANHLDAKQSQEHSSNIGPLVEKCPMCGPDFTSALAGVGRMD